VHLVMVGVAQQHEVPQTLHVMPLDVRFPLHGRRPGSEPRIV